MEATGRASGEKSKADCFFFLVFFNWLVGLEDYPGSCKLLRLVGGWLMVRW